MSTIERARRRRPGFTQVSNDAMRDPRLSLRDKGLLTYLVGHDDGWRVTLDSLAKIGPDGRDAIKTSLASLKRAGYVKITRERLPSGRLGQSIWRVSDDPADLVDDDDEAVDNSDDSPQVENPPLVDSPQADSPPVAEPPVAEPPDLRRTREKNTKEQEQQENGPPAATEKQREYLRDLHLHGGGENSEAVEAWIAGLSAAEADAEIKEALKLIPRGRDYQGDPDSPGLSEKGRKVAAQRMIPRREGTTDDRQSD